MALAGHTLFISGASRGIGKAIALKCAADGANIVVAAKTAEPHPSLPGTIFTAAEEIEKAGGKALPCVVDIRSEENVRQAIDKARKEFGSIDILINNASAISLTPTAKTGMKKYDLMNQINARGTYLCSHLLLDDLTKAAAQGKQAHILNISPPLNMKPVWFAGQTAYTMAKYGMSMCVLGMSGELYKSGVGVNALWPRTAIYTSAMKMIQGEKIKYACRKPESMSDAAHLILSKDPKTTTGNFFVDDDLLKADGMTEEEIVQKYQYDTRPEARIMPDFFLDEAEPYFMALKKAGKPLQV